MDFEFVSVKTEQVEDLIIKDEILEEEEEEEDIGVEEDGTEDSEPHVKPEIEEILVKAEPELMEEQDEPEEEFGKDSYASNSTRPVDEKEDGTVTEPLASKMLYRCGHCSRGFMCRSSMAKHMKSAHKIRFDNLQQSDAHGKFACPGCRKVYTNKWSLRVHIANVHSGACEHLCKVCNKGFNEASALRDHVASAHVDVKKYACSVCARSFCNEVGLKKHVAYVHQDRTAKGKRQEFFVARHSCPICGKSFNQKCFLSVHMAGVHEGLKFTCPVCEESFDEMARLTDHMYVVHKGKKPVGCNICGKYFSGSGNLDKHAKDAHGGFIPRKPRKKRRSRRKSQDVRQSPQSGE